MNTTNPSDDEIQAYVDGRLDEPRRQAVEFYLTRHPERAEEVRAWQRDAQRLRAAFGAWPVLPDNPALDPVRIRMRRRQHVHTSMAIAAMLVLCLGFGALAGWQGRGWHEAHLAPPMGDALAAYRLVTQNRNLKLDIVSQSDNVLQQWVDKHFEHTVRLPDLRDSGFQPVGGRLFATDQGLAAMVLYEDNHGHAISFYVRPPNPFHRLLPRGERVDGGLIAQYGSDHSYNYALVTPTANDTEKRIAAKALQDVI